MEAVLKTGHQIFLESDRCSEGAFGFANSSKQLLVCVDNHKDNHAELADTFRHETLHLAQFCKGRKVGASAMMLFPKEKRNFIQIAVRDLHMPVASYARSKYGREAEARVLAHVLDEHQVAQILINECS